MGFFNKDMKIGQGEKYDVASTSNEGITAEELATINKKKTKLIDIYKKFDINQDGKLDKIELAMAMDGFTLAAGEDSKLSGKELDKLATEFNEKHQLTGDNAVKGKDMKDFLKSVRNFTKGDTKEATAGILLDDARIKDSEANGYTAVEGNNTIYQKDGKYYAQDIQDGKFVYKRVQKFEGENGSVNWGVMSDAQIKAEQEQEAKAAYNQKVADAAKVQGYTKNENGIYTKDGNLYIFNNDTGNFDRAKLVDGTLCVMSAEELSAEQAEIAEKQRKAQLAIPTDYTVQRGENFRTLIKQSLQAQGIEVTDVTMEAAINEFKQNNPGKLHGRAGREYLYAGDVVKIAGGLEDKANGDEIRKRALSVPTDDSKVKQPSNVDKKQTEPATEKPKPTSSNLNIVKVADADPNGMYKGKQFVPVKGKGLCKFNPALSAYEKYNGTYKGKYYKDGQIQSLANKALVVPDLLEYTPSSEKSVVDEINAKRSQPDYYRNYYTYAYKNGSLTPLYKDPTYDSNVQIKIGGRTFELANGNGSGYSHCDYKDFLEKFVDTKTGAICAKEYVVNTYFLVRGKQKLPVTIDKYTRALMVEIGGKKYDMNDIMSGKVKIK